MPLSDFKCIEAGHYVVWTLYYKTPIHKDSPKAAARDRQMAKHDKHQVHITFGLQHSPQLRIRVGWHKNEEEITKIYNVLRDKVVEFDWGAAFKKPGLNLKGKLEVVKEVCIFEGGSFHSLKGNVWPLEDVEKCIARFEAASDAEILWMFGKFQRQPRPCWQCLFCWFTCLCLCDQFHGLSKTTA